MKANTHPKFYTDAKVICACGHTFTTGSTKENISVEVCYKCHPYYTGEQRYLDIKGRVDVFQKKQEVAKKYIGTGSKSKKKEEKKEYKVKSLKELLGEM